MGCLVGGLWDVKGHFAGSFNVGSSRRLQAFWNEEASSPLPSESGEIFWVICPAGVKLFGLRGRSIYCRCFDWRCLVP